MGLKDTVGKVVKGILDATDNEGDYGGLKWHENYDRGYIVGGPDWYTAGGRLPASARKSDKDVDQYLSDMSGQNKQEDPGLGLCKGDKDWEPDGA